MIQRSMVHADAAAAAVARTIDRGRGAKTYALVRRTRLFRPVGPHLPPYKRVRLRWPGWLVRCVQAIALALRAVHSRSPRTRHFTCGFSMPSVALRTLPPTPYPSPAPPHVRAGSGLVGLASLPLLPGRCDATATATAACVHVTLPCRAAACARSLRSPSPSPPFGPCNTVETRRRTYDTVTPYHASPDCFLVSLRLPGSWAGQPQIKAVKAWVSRQKWQVLVFLKKYR